MAGETILWLVLAVVFSGVKVYSNYQDFKHGPDVSFWTDFFLSLMVLFSLDTALRPLGLGLTQNGIGGFVIWLVPWVIYYNVLKGWSKKLAADYLKSKSSLPDQTDQNGGSSA